MRRRLAFAMLVVLMAGMFAFGTAGDCCIELFGAPFCYDAQSGAPTGGGGVGQPTPTPAPPPHVWQSLPGFGGTFSDWGGTPDHHDSVGDPGEHAVDIGAGECDTRCPTVEYHDTAGSTNAAIDWSEFSCPGLSTGGELVKLRVTSADAGIFIGNAVYRHLLNAPRNGTAVNGMSLGEVNGNADPLRHGDCWTGPHVHQGVNSVQTPAVLTHLTGAGSNCRSNQFAVPSVPYYSIAW